MSLSMQPIYLTSLIKFVWDCTCLYCEDGQRYTRRKLWRGEMVITDWGRNRELTRLGIAGFTREAVQTSPRRISPSVFSKSQLPLGIDSIASTTTSMPTQTLGKRSSLTADPNDGAETPRSKLRKTYLVELHRHGRHREEGDIGKKVQHLEEAILKSLGDQPGLAKQILDLQASINTSIHNSIPFEPEALVVGPKRDRLRKLLPAYL